MFYADNLKNIQNSRPSLWVNKLQTVRGIFLHREPIKVLKSLILFWDSSCWNLKWRRLKRRISKGFPITLLNGMVKNEGNIMGTVLILKPLKLNLFRTLNNDANDDNHKRVSFITRTSYESKILYLVWSIPSIPHMSKKNTDPRRNLLP